MWKYLLAAKISIDGHGLLLRLRKTNTDMTAVLRGAPFLITLTKNHNQESNGWGTTVALMYYIWCGCACVSVCPTDTHAHPHSPSYTHVPMYPSPHMYTCTHNTHTDTHTLELNGWWGVGWGITGNWRSRSQMNRTFRPRRSSSAVVLKCYRGVYMYSSW